MVRAMKKKILTIKSNVRYNELKQYKKMFEMSAFDEVNFQLYLDKRPFEAKLKYGLVPSRLTYDRKRKFKIYLDGVVSKASDKALFQALKDLPPSKPILLMEILFAKCKEEMITQDNGDLEYHFTFLQY